MCLEAIAQFAEQTLITKMGKTALKLLQNIEQTNLHLKHIWWQKSVTKHLH